MKVFVAGATGETGRRIVKELVKRGISVRSLVRNIDSARAILPSEVELIKGDVLDINSLVTGLGDATVIICATGARPSLDPTGPYQVDYVGTKNLIDLAKQKNVSQFIIVSSLCVSQFFHPLNLFWLVLFWKKKAEEYLQNSGLQYTIVRPGGLKNEDNNYPLKIQEADTLFEGRIPRQKVAEVCVDSINNNDRFNQILEIVSNE